MNQDVFIEILLNDIEQIKNILTVKSLEYVRNENPFHNFEAGATITGKHPALVLDGFMLKHYISYRDILNDLQNGIIPKSNIVNEKIFDMIIYLLIQKQLINEQQQ